MFKSTNLFLAAAVVALAIGFAFWGVATSPAAAGESWLQILVTTFRLLFFRGGGSTAPGEAQWPVAVAQSLIFVLLPMATVIIGAVRANFTMLRQDLRTARARAKRDHVIVVGLGNTGMHVVRNASKHGDGIVAIERNAREANAVMAEQLGGTVLAGDGRDIRVLVQAGIARAAMVVICTGNDTENVDLALRIKQQIDSARVAPGRRITILTELRTDWMFAALTALDDGKFGSDRIDFRFFNTYRFAARALVRNLAPHLAPDRLQDTLVIIGFGTMGREVALELIRSLPTGAGGKARLLALDATAERRRLVFAATYPAAADFADMAFVTADLQTDAADVWRGVEEQLRAVSLLGIAVCLPDDSASLAVGLALRRILDRLGRPRVPIWIRLRERRALGALVADATKMADIPDRLGFFGEEDEILDPRMLEAAEIDAFAKALHESYRRRQQEAGDDAARPWDLLDEGYKQSSRRMADFMPIKFAAAGLSLTRAEQVPPLALTEPEIELLAIQEHRRWMIERRLDGWQYGPARDKLQQLNPLLVDWAALPADRQQSSRDAERELPAILSEAGYRVDRVAPGEAGS
jgi:voltage-gated potassium channel Kch